MLQSIYLTARLAVDLSFVSADKLLPVLLSPAKVKLSNSAHVCLQQSQVMQGTTPHQ